MKKPLSLLILFISLLYACKPSANSSVEKAMQVWGNCEKCKTRIEKAAKINGVSEANWNMDSKLLLFKVDTTIITVGQVLKSVAHAGHDNELFYADDYSYSALPESCQYERRSE